MHFVLAMSAIYDRDVRIQKEMSGAPSSSKEEESNRLSYVYIVLKTWHTRQYWNSSMVMRLVIPLVCYLQYISLYSIVPGVLRSCNITLTYNQSTERLQFIDSTWDTMLVSHSYVAYVCWMYAVIPILVCAIYVYYNAVIYMHVLTMDIGQSKDYYTFCSAYTTWAVSLVVLEMVH